MKRCPEARNVPCTIPDGDPGCCVTPPPGPIGRATFGQFRNRAPIGPDAVRAGYWAHKSSEHGGAMSSTCRACRRYLRGIALAAERAAGQACDPHSGQHLNPHRGCVLR